MAGSLLKNCLNASRPAYRACQQPTFNRSFHASSANMVIKAYFDCTWTGPKLEADANGKVTSQDAENKRMLSSNALTDCQGSTGQAS